MVLYLYWILSLLLYLFAPKEYSFSLCTFMCILYVFFSIYTIKKCTIDKIWISYTLIFLISFFFVNFAYPVFIYPIDPRFLLMFTYAFDDSLINKGTALCCLASSSYMLGYMRKFKKNTRNSDNTLKINLFPSRFIILKIFTILVLLVCLVQMFSEIGKIYGDVEVNFQSSLLLKTLVIPLIIIICQKNKSILKNNFKKFISTITLPLLVIGSYSILSLALGSRENVVSFGIILVFLFIYYVKRISFLSLISLIFLGIFTFSIIAEIRNLTDKTDFKLSTVTQSKSYQNTTDISPIWNLFNDLICNNRNLYVGMEYTDKKGMNYGVNYIPYLLGPIPFLPSFVTQLFFNKSPVEYTSQQILTDYTRDELGYYTLNYELGSNLVVDVFMAFGALGVVIAFYLLGSFIGYLEIHKTSNILCLVTYVILLSSSVFICRGSFFGPFRAIVWGIIVTILVCKITYPQKYKSTGNK